MGMHVGRLMRVLCAASPLAILALTLTCMNQSCPNLDETLRRWAKNPTAESAANLGLEMAEGRVRVIVELAGGDRFPDLIRLGVVEEGRYQNFVQVLAPPDALCALAELPAVGRVRPPYPATLTIQ